MEHLTRPKVTGKLPCGCTKEGDMCLEHSPIAEYLEQLFEQMDRGASIADIMRQAERTSGYQVVVPGEVNWLPLEDWDPSIVVSLDDNKVRLVAILARNPGNGALRRLICAIKTHGMVPQIIAPTFEMRATVKRWGWRMRMKGMGFEAQEIWYPRPRAQDQK